MHGKKMALALWFWLAAAVPLQAQTTADPAAAPPPVTQASVPAAEAAAAPSPGLALAPAAASPAPAPAVLTRPGLVKAETLSSADTGWMMTATALVLLMSLPGIALFYGGMVRKKSVLNVMACVVATSAIVSLLWFAVGYSIAFTPGGGALGPFMGGT